MAKTEAGWLTARGVRTSWDNNQVWSKQEASEFYRETLAEAGQIAGQSLTRREHFIRRKRPGSARSVNSQRLSGRWGKG